MWIDVTWGAGGSTADTTLSLCETAMDVTGLDVLMHLTCTNVTVDMTRQVLHRSCHDAVDRVVDLRGGDRVLVAAPREDGRLVHQVGQVRPGEPRAALRDLGEGDLRVHLLVLRVHVQDLEAPLHVGHVDRHLPVEAARAQQGGVEHVGAVGLVHEDDAGRVLLGLLEEVPHARGAHAHEHLHKLRARDGEEGHPGLARDGLREERLARAR